MPASFIRDQRFPRNQRPAVVYTLTFARRRAFKRSNDPSAFSLTLYTHFQPIKCLPDGAGTNSQVSCSKRAWYSSSIAARQPASCIASFKLRGSIGRKREVYASNEVGCSRTLVMDRVDIWWVRVWGLGGAGEGSGLIGCEGSGKAPN